MELQGICKIIYEAISVKDGKEGQHGTFYPYGIKINGEWHNGILGSQEQVDGMKAKKGQEVELFFYVDEKYGNKVRFVTDKDRKEAPKKSAEEELPIERSYQSPEEGLIEALKRIEVLEKAIFSKNSEGKSMIDVWAETYGTKEPETPITDEIKEESEKTQESNESGQNLPF